MSTVKGNQYLQALDASRCNGEWDQVQELCRKVQKHTPGRKCLALIASTESKLLSLRPPPPGAASNIIASYFASLTVLQDALLEEIGSYSLPLPNLPNPSGGGESPVVIEADIIQARVVIAGIWSLKGEWVEVLTIVPGEDEVGERWAGGPGKSDYMDIMRIKALVLKGLALSHTNPDQSLPLQVYRAATRLHASYPLRENASPTLIIWAEKALALYALATYRVWLEEHAPPSTPLPVTAPSSPDKPYRDSEHILDEADGEETEEEEDYVGVAIGKTIVNESMVASAFRSFHNFIHGASIGQASQSAAARASNPEREEKRKEVYRYYFKFLSLLLLPPGHPNRPVAKYLPPSPNGRVKDPTVSMVGNTSLRKTGSSKAGTTEQLREELKAISKVFEKYLMASLQFPKADEYHEIIGEWVDQVVENWRILGGSTEDAAPVVEILYRASRKSFHSPRILRHLFHTLTATGNFQDALAALDTYLTLVQTAMDRIQKGNHEKDFDTDKIIFQTAVEGIRVLCKFIGNGQKAMDVASKMEKWVDEWRLSDPEILSEVYRGIGMANATFSRQTLEGELRPDAQQAAAEAFRKGLSYDPIDIQGWYGLALIEAEMRVVDSAMESVRKGLGALKYNFLDNEDPDDVEGNARDYKRFAVPLLHLLALLMTAKEDFDGAEKVCKNAFDIVGEGREAVNDLGVADKVAIFELMMSQLAIVEAVEDSETAISMAETLLELYSMLFDGTHLVQRLQVGSLEDNIGGITSSNLSSRPTTTASKRSRLFGRSHKKQFSSSYSSLQTANGADPPPSLGGTIKRPKSGHQSLAGMSTGTSGQLPATPKIQVTDTHVGASTPPSEKSQKRLMRSGSVSGNTVRRMRSLGSLRLKNEVKIDEPPTPPLPTSTEASSLNFDSPAGSVSGHDPHLFHTLKNKLHHHHHLKYAQSSAAASASSMPLEMVRDEAAVQSSPAPSRAENIPHNLPQHKLPYPLGTLGRTISDDEQLGRERSIRRPIQLPEPKLAVDDERKQVLGALRKAWICVAGLYRRAGFFGDALMATEEASGLVGKEGEGEADVVAERGYLALTQGRGALAAELFEQAIALDYDNPQAIIGLSKLLLNVRDMDLHPDDPLPSSFTRPGSRGTKTSEKTASTTESEDDEEAFLNKLAGRNRALGLLEKLVVSPRGWDLPDAWFLLADALEKLGEVERAKCALWRVVELEDGTGVRGWRSCGVGVV
ncbi:hypothetical protein BDD12DRAFT_849459 [Trichophaea hybrida]|nr:hypothetical protein BDD12DRAFT_849459 [Trichophaea hybrida]